MRTTIRLDDDLLAQAKEAAARSGRTLSELIEDALRQSLSRKNALTKRLPVRLPSSGKGWLRPGVNLDSAAELLHIMDSGDATSGTS
jgi:hypothetical protein